GLGLAQFSLGILQQVHHRPGIFHARAFEQVVFGVHLLGQFFLGVFIEELGLVQAILAAAFVFIGNDGHERFNHVVDDHLQIVGIFASQRYGHEFGVVLDFDLEKFFHPGQRAKRIGVL